jgi:sulfatase maturation enzyme AslB (radical SAM superfamily)
VITATGPVAEAIEQGVIGSRLWFYANYHCNLACSYCLTESAPDVDRRELDPDHVVDLAEQGRVLGFTAIGVTGGEPFLVAQMPELLARLSDVMPVVVLSNGTLFTGRRLERMRPLGERDVRVQISLDRSEAVANDEMRGPENFRKVVDAIPRLVDLGIGVRIASTLAWVDEDDMAKLCALHRSLGVPDEDHVVRGVVRRGRALTEGLGEPAGIGELGPELTITADGAFWSPFGPTVVGGLVDTDLLVTRAVSPLSRPAESLVGLVSGSGYQGPADDRFT